MTWTTKSIAEELSHPRTDVSLRYWARQAQAMYALYSAVGVETVTSGRVTDAEHVVSTGSSHRRYAADGWIVIVAATGGSHGRSRKVLFGSGCCKLVK
jgi:hypothetical protein